MKLRPLALIKSLTAKIIVGTLLALILLWLGLTFLPTQNFVLNEKTKSLIQSAVQKQYKIEKEIRAYAQSESYSFDNPLVIQNPYGTAPLTALLMFDTPEAVQISLHVPGKTPQASVDFTFDGYNKRHEIPIYGLYAGQANSITLTAKNRTGQEVQTTLQLQTEPLPVYLDPIHVTVAKPEQYAPGMNYSFLDHKPVFDINGDIRWYSTLSTFQTFAPLKNGHYLYTYVVEEDPNVVMEEDLLGKIYAVFYIPGDIHHDLIELPNRNILVTSEDTTTTWEEDFLYELDRQSGFIVRSFDLKKYLDQNRKGAIDSYKEDWLHLNSIVTDPTGSSLILSSRSQSAIIKMTYPKMEIQWILSPHDGWADRYKPYLLTPTGENFEWSWSQHHATILSEQTINGDPYIELLLFDNGLYRSLDRSTALSGPDSYSRMVHYKINESKKTIEQVWQYGKERGGELFSVSRGSAYLLANGNILGEWSDLAKDVNGQPSLRESKSEKVSVSSKTIEVNPADNQVVFEATMDNVMNYRTFRGSFYDDYAQKGSIISEPINNTTSMTIEKQVIVVLHQVKINLDGVLLRVKQALRTALMTSGIWDYLR